MSIELEQVIEIHARVLVHRHKHEAPANAREHANSKMYCGDAEGYEVWLAVAIAADRILTECRAPGTK